jgi:predicted secreted Zn-dependent protease
MKYENFDKAVTLVEQIKRHEERLADISGNSVTVIVNSREQHGRVFSIGAYPSYEHDYTPLAINFIADIKRDLTNRIDHLKSQLAEL